MYLDRSLTAVAFLLLFPASPAQQPAASAPPPAASSPAALVSNGPGEEFKFTKVDDTLLAEANAADAQFETKGLVFHEAGVQAYLDSVGNRVLAGRPVPEKVTYRFLVLRDPLANAFAQPNGSIYVTTGLLALLQNEGELAAVLSHETAHVYKRHPYLENRNLRKKSVEINLISLAATVALAGAAGPVAGAAIRVGTEASTLILVESVYGYSREMESQADRDGLAAMTAAGYDPHAMASFFELLDRDSRLEYEPYKTFYHDHPKLEARRAEALEFAGKNTPPGAQTGSENDYLTAVAPAIVPNVSMDLNSRRPRTAMIRATRLVNAFPDNPQYQVLLGESYRALGAKTSAPTADELTPDGREMQRKLVTKMTEEQEQQELLHRPGGPATLEANRAAAEKAFQSAIQSQPDYAIAYRELGFLYQDEARYSGAADNYRHYLQLVASTSLDRYRIERRLAQVLSLQAQQSH
ncbi:MAG: M48 family metalloprotease [Terracidiphilus sp.]|jgi:hypothetical protein